MESKNKRGLDGSLGKNGIHLDLYNLLHILEYRLLIIVKQFEVEKKKEDEKLNKVKNKIHILVHEQEMAWRMAKNALENMNQSSFVTICWYANVIIDEGSIPLMKALTHVNIKVWN
jgi:hypothetical protein